MFYENTIGLVMHELTKSYDTSTNSHLFYELCERIWFIKDEWMLPYKIETIARLISNSTLISTGDIILYNDGIEEKFGIYINNGSSVSRDDLYLMDL